MYHWIAANKPSFKRLFPSSVRAYKMQFRQIVNMIIDMEHFVWMYILNNYFPTFLSPTSLTDCLPSFVMTLSPNICSPPFLCLSLSVLFPSLPTYLYHPFLPAYLQHRNLSPFSLLFWSFCHPSSLSPCMPACFPAPSYFICS